MDTHNLGTGHFKEAISKSLNESQNILVLIIQGCFEEVKATESYLPQSIHENVYDDVKVGNAALTVPLGTKNKYESAGVWKNFGTIIEQ